MSLGHVWFLRGVGNSLTPPSDRVGNSLLDASATMNVYDSIERGAADECEPLRGRRPRTFTLTQLLVACVAVSCCTLAATTVVNTHLANFDLGSTLDDDSALDGDSALANFDDGSALDAQLGSRPKTLQCYVGATTFRVRYTRHKCLKRGNKRSCWLA